MPVLRWVVLGLLLFVFVFGLLLLLRSMVGVIGTIRDDADYPLIHVNRLITGPMLVDVVLNEPRDLDGEQRANGRALLVVAVARGADAATYSVANAASPLDGSRLQLDGNQLVAPDGRAWTLDGVAVDPTDPPLQVFPARVRDDLVVVDFTEPTSP